MRDGAGMVPPELLVLIFATRPRWERGCVFYFVCQEWRRALRSDTSLWGCFVVVPTKPDMATLKDPSSRLSLPETSRLIVRRDPAARRRREHHTAFLHVHQGALPLLLTELSSIPDARWVEELHVLDDWATFTSTPNRPQVIRTLCAHSFPNLRSLRLPLHQLLTTKPNSRYTSDPLTSDLRGLLVGWLGATRPALTDIDLHGGDALSEFTKDSAFAADALALPTTLRASGQFALARLPLNPSWHGRLQVISLGRAHESWRLVDTLLRTVEVLPELRRLAWSPVALQGPQLAKMCDGLAKLRSLQVLSRRHALMGEEGRVVLVL